MSLDKLSYFTFGGYLDLEIAYYYYSMGHSFILPSILDLSPKRETLSNLLYLLK